MFGQSNDEIGELPPELWLNAKNAVVSKSSPNNKVSSRQS